MELRRWVGAIASCLGPLRKDIWSRHRAGFWSATVLAALFTISWAAATTYVYDPNGRLVVAKNDAGQSARYVYDSLGNIIRIERLEADDLAIFGFSPDRGAPGASVKVHGQGFSALTAGNTVTFNGVAATVQAASVDELTATVPDGATTGPIAVVVGSNTAVSSVDFVVDEDAHPPVIESVSPLVAAVGDSITLGGQHFYPVAGQTSVRLNQKPVVPSSIADTALAFAVPAGASSGKVSVTTPYGIATSTEDVLVTPSGVSSADIEQIKRLLIDSPPQSFSVTATGKYAAAFFDGSAGDYLSAQFRSIDVSSIGYSLYGTNNQLIVSGTVSATSPTIHLPRMTASGTYLLLMKPVTGPATWNLEIEKNKAVAVNGSHVDTATTVQAQGKRLIFTAEAGANLGLGISDLVLAGTGSYMTVIAYGPNGAALTSATCYAMYDGCGLNLSNLAAGTYSVVAQPYGSSQTMSFNATLSSDVTGTLQPDVAANLALSRRGQNGRLSFAGNAGQTLALQLANQSTGPVNRTVNYRVLKPDGSLLASLGVTTGGTINLPNLPVTGTYTVFVDPNYGETMAGQVLLATGTAEGTQLDGTSGSYATTLPGQNAYLTFTAEAGANLGLGISDLVLTGTGSYMTVIAYGPNGAALTSATCYAMYDGCGLNLSNLAAGTYSVVAQPYGSSQTMSFNATLSSDVTGTLQPDVAANLALTRRGQNGRLSFIGSTGQTLALQLANQTTEPANRSVNYRVLKPDGSFSTSVSIAVGGVINLSNLPATGTYTVFVDPSYGETMAGQVLLATGTAEGTQLDGTSGSYATTLPGQNAYLTFTAEAGANLGLGISDLVLAGTGSYMTVIAYGPNGAALTSATCYAMYDGCGLNLSNLAAGTYSVVAQPYGSSQTMSFNATLSSDVTGTLQSDVAANLALSRRGQNGRLSFAGNAGQTLALQLANQSTGPVNRTVNYRVLKPDGSLLASLGVTTGGTINLPNLPVTGTYTVFVDPNYGETMTGQVLLATGTAEGTQLDGTSGSYATTLPGQTTYLTFTAEAGANLGLGISELAVVGTYAYATVAVYGPTGTHVVGGNCFVTYDGCGFNLPNLAAGTYSVVVSPITADHTMSFKATLSSDVTGTLQPDVAANLALSRRGQNGRLIFAGNVGQTLALQLANQSTGPANRTVNYRVNKPDGSLLTSLNVTAGGAINLPNLPVTGTYTVFVDPNYGETVASQLLLSTGTVEGTTVNGASGSYATTLPGQTTYLTFAAEAGANLGLGISELVTGGYGYISVAVYGPTGIHVAGATCYASSDGCGINLPNLIAGTHSVVVSPVTADQTMSFKATISSDVTGTLQPDVATNLALSRRGQNGRLSFAGTAGQTLALQLANQSTGPANRTVSYRVNKPDGSLLTSLGVTSGGVINLPNLPVTGTYTVFVDPNYGETVASQLLLSTGTVEGTTVNGASGSYATTLPGQTTYLTFAAEAGANLGLGISELAVVGPYAYASVAVYGPTGAHVVGGNCFVSQDGCGFNLSNLVAGTYSVVVSPITADHTMSFKATLSSDVTGTLQSDVAADLMLGRRGQNGRLTFAGNAGQTLALQLANQTTLPANRSVHYRVLKPDGSFLTSLNIAVGGAINLPNLPVTGTYTVFMDPNYGETTASQLLLSTGTAEGTTMDGASGSYTTTLPGQTTYLTFTAEAGANLGLGISELGVVGTHAYVSVAVYGPTGTYMVGANCFVSQDGCGFNLPNLAAGTYSMVVSPIAADQTMSFKAALSSDVTGTLQPDVAANLALSRRGQNGRLTFAGTAGQTIAIQAAGQVTVPANRTVNYRVLKPDGSLLTSQNVAGGATLNLINLPVTGNYLVYVDPNYGESLSGYIRLATGTAEGTELDGDVGVYPTSYAGQAAYLTFVATQGLSARLGISQLIMDGGTYAYVYVYRPDGSSLSSTYCGASTSGCRVDLTNLVAGTYSVIVSPQSNTQTMSFRATLSTVNVDTLQAGLSRVYSINRHGQYSRIAFGVSSTQSFILRVNNQQTNPLNRAVSFRIYRPSGSLLGSYSVTDNGNISLPALSEVGEYSVVVDPPNGETVSHELLLEAQP